MIWNVPMILYFNSINHLDLPADRRNNITLRLYPGGHMLYTNPEALAQLKKDLEIFIKIFLESDFYGTEDK